MYVVLYFSSILADECTDVVTHEQLSICIRFEDEDPVSPLYKRNFLVLSSLIELMLYLFLKLL